MSITESAPTGAGFRFSDNLVFCEEDLGATRQGPLKWRTWVHRRNGDGPLLPAGEQLARLLVSACAAVAPRSYASTLTKTVLTWNLFTTFRRSNSCISCGLASSVLICCAVSDMASGAHRVHLGGVGGELSCFPQGDSEPGWARWEYGNGAVAVCG